jgi:cryptochrome
VGVISFEKDSEAIWKTRDDAVKNMCKKYDVQVIERVSYTLYDPEDIHNLNNNSVPNTFEDFKKICAKIGEPEKPRPKIDLKLISNRLIKTDDLYIKTQHQVPDIEFFNKKKECDEQETCLFEGGETKALELCTKRLECETESFRNGKMNPNLKKPIMFTNEVSLSPYLRFGCLSIRKFYWDIKNCYETVKKKIFKSVISIYFSTLNHTL